MYFIPWALFLLVIILAVPIVSMLEKRKSRAAFEAAHGGFDEDEEVGEEAEEAVAEEAVAEEGEAEAVVEVDGFGGEGGDLADDEFAAFE